MTKYILRYYQEEAVQSVFDYFQHKQGNPLIALPGGTGKSLVIGEFIRRAVSYYPQTRVMMLTHVKELIKQNFEKLTSMWEDAPAGIYSAGLKSKETDKQVIFAGVQSAARNIDAFGYIDLVVIDEAHLVSPTQTTMYQKVLNTLAETNPHLKVIGLTATPYRMGLGTLLDGGIFTDFCYNKVNRKDFNKFIADGFLSTLIPKATSTQMDVSDVKSNSDDFVLKHLQIAVDKEELTRAIVEETIETAYASDRKKWLVFASGVEHAIHVCDMMRENGIATEVVHSKMTKKDRSRDDIIQDFLDGKITCLVNNGILTTGNDFPDLDLIVIMRPTQSIPLWIQILSRGTRIAPGKENCLVLDFGGNTARLGPINDPILPRKKGERKGKNPIAPPIKLCPICGTYNHASVRHCVSCGEEFPRETKLALKPSEEAIVASDTPQIENFPVDTVIYTKHNKIGGTPSLKVAYHCGLRVFNEFVCLQHSSSIVNKAKRWWSTRSQWPAPDVIDEALMVVNDLRIPKAINVVMNKKYPEIVGHIF